MKQNENVTQLLNQERRKIEKFHGVTEPTKLVFSNNNVPMSDEKQNSISNIEEAKTGPILVGANEFENEEVPKLNFLVILVFLTELKFLYQVPTPTNPSKSFIANVAQDSMKELINFSHDFSSIQPIYSHDSLSHDSGFKTGSSSSNCADHEELLKVLTELEDSKQQQMNAQMTISELEQQLSVLSQENNCLQTRLAQSTFDEMKSVHEELSFLEEVRQGQMCTRCLKIFDERLAENTSNLASECDDEDTSLLEILNQATNSLTRPVYRSAINIKVCQYVSTACYSISFIHSILLNFFKLL